MAKKQHRLCSSATYLFLCVQLQVHLRSLTGAWRVPAWSTCSPQVRLFLSCTCSVSVQHTEKRHGCAFPSYLHVYVFSYALRGIAIKKSKASMHGMHCSHLLVGSLWWTQKFYICVTEKLMNALCSPCLSLMGHWFVVEVGIVHLVLKHVQDQKQKCALHTSHAQLWLPALLLRPREMPILRQRAMRPRKSRMQLLWTCPLSEGWEKIRSCCVKTSSKSRIGEVVLWTWWKTQ